MKFSLPSWLNLRVKHFDFTNSISVCASVAAGSDIIMCVSNFWKRNCE
jgi:hypothetical protein